MGWKASLEEDVSRIDGALGIVEERLDAMARTLDVVEGRLNVLDTDTPTARLSRRLHTLAAIREAQAASDEELEELRMDMLKAFLRDSS